LAQKPSKKKQYTKGELNKLIDSLLHPLFVNGDAFVAIDTVLHGLVEQDPKQTVRKFIRYTLPKILDKAFGNH